MDRERTNSMTKLTKVIALEVNKPRFKRIEDKINQLEEKIEFALLNTDVKEMVKSIQSSCIRAGDVWTRREDSILAHEVEMAIATIAKSHDRSYGAITARINHKDLI